MSGEVRADGKCYSIAVDDTLTQLALVTKTLAGVAFAAARAGVWGISWATRNEISCSSVVSRERGMAWVLESA